MTHIYRLLGVVAIVGLMALTACSSPGQSVPDESPAPEQPPVTDPAVYCSELADLAVLNSTRDAYSDVAPADFDAAVAACAENPDAIWPDTVQKIVQAAQNLSNLTQTFPISDIDGYSFDLGVDFGLVSITADPSSQPPGVTAAAREMSLYMKVVNTTPARELNFKKVNGIIEPLSLPTFLFAAVYKAGNPVCTAILGRTDRNCYWNLGFARMETGLNVAAGSEYVLKTWGGQPNGGEASLLLAGIPESSWAEIEPYLGKPDGYSIVYSGGDGGRFTTQCGEASTVFDPVFLVYTAPC